MRMARLGRSVGILALAVGVGLPAAPAMAGGHGGQDGHRSRTYTCTGGEIASGRYRSITVTGECSVAADAVITVARDVTVKAGATLDAQTAPSTITVGRDVTAGRGSVLGLGCQPAALTGNSAHPCTTEPDGHSIITVGGDVTAFKAAAVLLNGVNVEGNVTLRGGGGPIPWAIKNNTIGRNLRVSGQTTDWLGVLFNTVGRDVKLRNITVTDTHPDAPGVYIVRNNVGRNLVCTHLKPGVSGGFVPGSVNVVGGRAFGQCKDLV